MRRLVAMALGLAVNFAFGLACGATGSDRAAVMIEQVTAPSPELEGLARTAIGAAVAGSSDFAGEGAGLAGALRLVGWVSASDQGGRPQAGRPQVGGAVPAALFLYLELEVPAALRRQFDVPAIVARAQLDGVVPSEAGLRSAATTALEVLALRLALAGGDAEAAALLLRSEDPELVLLALEWTRDHPNPLLADAVAVQVGHADLQVVRLALEVLAQIGEGRHASAVVRRVERWPALAREGYATLAVLGGPDAVGFLRFAAANEDDLELQREAERALSAALAGTGERVPTRPHGVDLPKVARGHRQ
jgi:hypothetical protein